MPDATLTAATFGKKPSVFSEVLLWCLAGFWVGLIYSTLSLVPLIRKMAVERFGQDVWDLVYVLFGVIGLVIVIKAFIDLRGKQLVYRFISIVLIGVLYSIYLTKLPYAVERIHFLEYGITGILLYAAIAKRISNWTAAILSAVVVYFVGLGDETIQHAVPGRVSEIRDVVTDLFSGILGICLYLFAFVRERPRAMAGRTHLRFTIAACAAATVATSLYLWRVQGFGCVYETKGMGRIYSSLNQCDFEMINSSGPDVRLSGEIQARYDNEALRHLLQRDFYLTNDFLIAGGGHYRDYWKSWCENRVLETWYGRFLASHAAEKSAGLLQALDRQVAKNIHDMPVVWPDSIKKLMTERVERQRAANQGFESRVKSTIITSFSERDLLLSAVCALFLLGFAWVKAPGDKIRRRPG
jgi:hypothetical protein